MMTHNLFPKMRRPWLVGMTGLLAMLFDWLENVVIIILLRNYPARLDDVAGLGSCFTQLKWLFNAGSGALILVGLLALGIRKIGVKQNPGDGSGART